LPAFSATRIAAQTFYALGDTRTPVWAGLASVAANLVLALTLMWPLQHAGLALATSLSAYVNLGLLCWLLRRRLGPIGGRQIAGSLLRTGGASAVLLFWCVWAGARLGAGWAGASWTAGALVAGMLVYMGAAAVLRAPELSALFGMLRRRGQSLPGAGSG
jgi:putative peptidoglycan lipid II flippase